MRILFLMLFFFSGCGFLDAEILLDDETYQRSEEYLELGEMTFHLGGSGGSYELGRLGRRSIKSRSELAEGQSSSYSHTSYRRGFGDESSESVRSKEGMLQKGASDPRSGFIALVNNYGAKAHDLEDKL